MEQSNLHHGDTEDTEKMFSYHGDTEITDNLI